MRWTLGTHVDAGLIDSFRELVTEFLETHPDLPHEWTDEPGETKLAFAKCDSDGFDVAISIGAQVCSSRPIMAGT